MSRRCISSYRLGESDWLSRRIEADFAAQVPRSSWSCQGLGRRRYQIASSSCHRRSFASYFSHSCLLTVFHLQVNLLYWLTLLQLHRPFFSRVNHPNAAAPNSTEKCLLAASHIVRLIKVQQRGSGYRFVHPTFTQ